MKLGENVKKIIMSILLLVGLFIMSGCGVDNEQSRELVNDIIKAIPQDKGLEWASEQAPIIDLTATDKGIPFTVHQLIADSARIILIASYENEKVQSNITTVFSPTLKYISGQQIFSSSTQINTWREADNKAICILTLHTSLDPKENKLIVVLDEIDGMEGDWSLEVPIFRPKNDHGTITNLSTNNDGFSFFASLTLGSTMTDVAWSLKDTFSEEQAEKRGCYLASNRGLREIWKDYFLDPYHEERIVLLNNGEIVPSYTIAGGSRSDNFISSNGFHLPIKEPGELKIILKNIAMQKTEPINFNLEKSNNQWQELITNIEGTTVKVENIDLHKGEITISYQSGRLKGMTSPVLKDSKGNEYQYQNMTGEIPGLDFLALKMHEEKLGREDIAKEINELKRYQTLHFEGLPTDIGRLDLSFQEVIFLSKNQWELNVTY